MRALDRRGSLHAVAVQRLRHGLCGVPGVELASHGSSSDPCSRPWQRADQSEARRATKISCGGRSPRTKRVCICARARAARGLSTRASRRSSAPQHRCEQPRSRAR